MTAGPKQSRSTAKKAIAVGRSGLVIPVGCAQFRCNMRGAKNPCSHFCESSRTSGNVRGLPRTTTSMQEPGSILPNTMRMVLQPNDKICHTTSSWIERLNSSALSESSILTGSRQRGKSNTWSRHRLLRYPIAGVLRNGYSPHGFPKPLNPINCISGCSDYIG